MTDLHPLARLKEAALAWVRSTPGGFRGDAFRLSMLVGGDDSVTDVRLRPERTPEDLRYEVAEWTSADTSNSSPVEILGRASSIDGARALLAAEHAKDPRKVLFMREGARVMGKAGPGTEA